MNKITTREITKASMMAAIVFLATYAIKIPTPNGYTHLGDCMIFIGVILIGRKNGALAAGIGAGFADLIGGYSQWILPTFIIKYLMAYIMGLFIEKLMVDKKYNWLIGSIIGGIVQVLGYGFTEGVFYGVAAGFLSMPANVVQTSIGIGITCVFVSVLKTNGILEKYSSV